MDIEKLYEKRISNLEVDYVEVIKSIREAQAQLQVKQQEINDLATERIKVETKIADSKEFLRIIQEEKQTNKKKPS